MKNPLAALAAALILAAPLAASAQDVPSYAAAPSEDAQIRGRIENFDGAFNLQVRDDQGYVDNVELHDGTIINPTGLGLAPGMVVSILGYNSGSYFTANEVDTPYNYDAGVPYYGGHPWNYYGSSIDLSFFFGNAGWWHGNDFGGAFNYDRGVRVYDNVRVRNVYENNNYNDRRHAYVSPSNGGYSRDSYAQRPAGFAPQTHPSGLAPGREGGYSRGTGSAGYANGNGNTFHGGAERAAPVARSGGDHGGNGGGNRGNGGGDRGNGGGGDHHR